MYFVENLSSSGCLKGTIMSNLWLAEPNTRTPRENVNKWADVGNHMAAERKVVANIC